MLSHFSLLLCSALFFQLRHSFLSPVFHYFTIREIETLALRPQVQKYQGRAGLLPISEPNSGARASNHEEAERPLVPRDGSRRGGLPRKRTKSGSLSPIDDMTSSMLTEETETSLETIIIMN